MQSMVWLIQFMEVRDSVALALLEDTLYYSTEQGAGVLFALSVPWRPVRSRPGRHTGPEPDHGSDGYHLRLVSSTFQHLATVGHSLCMNAWGLQHRHSPSTWMHRVPHARIPPKWFERVHADSLYTLSAFTVSSKTWNWGRKDLRNPSKEFFNFTAVYISRPSFWSATFALSEHSKTWSHNVAMNAVSSLHSFFRRGCASVPVSHVSGSPCTSVCRLVSMLRKLTVSLQEFACRDHLVLDSLFWIKVVPLDSRSTPVLWRCGRHSNSASTSALIWRTLLPQHGCLRSMLQLSSGCEQSMARKRCQRVLCLYGSLMALLFPSHVACIIVDWPPQLSMEIPFSSRRGNMVETRCSPACNSIETNPTNLSCIFPCNQWPQHSRQLVHTGKVKCWI